MQPSSAKFKGIIVSMLRIVLPFLFFLSSNIFADIKIVASIKPIHSIASSITQGVGKVDLLLDSRQSAHYFHLKPSQMTLINNADLVIAINPKMEQGLNKALKNLDKDKIVYMVKDNKLNQNYHTWIDINKMQKFAKKLTLKLSSIYPKHKDIFVKNLAKLNQSLENINTDIKHQLEKYKNKPLIMYANALEHFVNSNELNSVGMVVVYHHQRLSIKSIINARKIIKNTNVGCLLSSIEIPEKRINSITEDLTINNSSIDIIGFDENKGTSLYANLIHNIANKVEQCLK